MIKDIYRNAEVFGTTSLFSFFLLSLPRKTTYHMKELFSQLLELPVYCVYGFINESDKMIYLGYSRNTCDLLLTHVKHIKSNNHLLSPHKDKIKFVIIETLSGSQQLLYRFHFHVSQYKSLGYKFYNKIDKNNRSIKHFILSDFRNKYFPLFYLYIMYYSRKEELVGVFESMSAMESFKKEHYPEGKIEKLVVCKNPLTKQYLEHIKKVDEL